MDSLLYHGSYTTITMIYISYFRATNTNSDVWLNILRNWNHFFWLTGEFPDTLQLVVSKIERRFFHHYPRGRRASLSVRNQVIKDISYSLKCQLFMPYSQHDHSKIAAQKWLHFTKGNSCVRLINLGVCKRQDCHVPFGF